MEKFKEIIDNSKNINIIESIIIIIISILLYKGILYLFNKSEKRISNRRRKTYFKLIRNLIRYIFSIITILILLQINGIDVTSLLAGVGIAGAIVGLAVQDWLKDIIRGTTILSDTYFEVGDIVKFGDIEGKVLVVGLQTTKIQDLRTSNVLSIANRNIEKIEKVSNLIYVNIPMPYELKVKEAEKIVSKIIENIKDNDNVFDCRYKGVNNLAESCINYLIEIECDQNVKLQVNRDSLRCILKEFEKNNISVPYTQIDIHTK